ncbi:MAG: recombinase family protein [Ruminococcaceae bacterium]|nr:recombinase family protein [Oscillospiraceae bacterium]
MENEFLKIGAAYIRVSDERQDEYSPDSQLKKIREYATKEGYLIPEEYVFYDDGISGKSTKKRDDFNRMISLGLDKNNHPFDRIYVWKFSRFARSQEDSIIAKNALKKKGVTVVSVSEAIPEGPFGDLIERIIEWMDEFYLKNLSGEVTRGMTEKASRGEPTCAPPFGYLMKDGKYYPDEESGNADIVREVFTLYANGVKQREIAILLGEKGIRTKRGNIPENRWINYMLHNHCYIGKIRWTPDGSRAISKRQLDNESIMIVDGHHKPIISLDLWNKVQSMLNTQKQIYPKYAKTSQPIEHMLKGLVRCSACGGTLAVNGTSGKAKVPCLQCCNYSRGSCHTSHSITLTKIEETFIAGLKQAIGEKQFTISPEAPKKLPSNTVDYAKLILIEERRLERAKSAYLAEIDTIEQYAANKKEIESKISNLKAKRDADSKIEFNPKKFEKKAIGIVKFIEKKSITPAEKNEALRTIIEKVVYEKANNNLAIYFHNL